MPEPTYPRRAQLAAAVRVLPTLDPAALPGALAATVADLVQTLDDLTGRLDRIDRAGPGCAACGEPDASRLRRRAPRLLRSGDLMRRAELAAAVAEHGPAVEYLWRDRDAGWCEGYVIETFPEDGAIMLDTCGRHVVARPRDLAAVRPAR